MRGDVRFLKDLKGPDQQWYVELELEPLELEAIGHVSAQWAFFEYHIFEHSKILAERVGQPLPKEAESDSARQRMRAWKTLAETCLNDLPEDRTRVLDLIERASSLQGERHKLIHGLIQWSDADREKLEVFTRANPRGTPWRVDAKRIQRFARKIAVLNADLLNVHNEIPGFPDFASPSTSLPRRPGTPIRVEIPPDPENEAKLRSFLEKHKRRKQSSEEK